MRSPLVGSTTETKSLEIGKGRAGDGYAVLDLVGDATYTDFGMRVVRKPGVNADSAIEHRGTGNLLLSANDAGGIVFGTNGVGRVEVHSAGEFEIGKYSFSGAKMVGFIRKTVFYGNRLQIVPRRVLMTNLLPLTVLQEVLTQIVLQQLLSPPQIIVSK